MKITFISQGPHWSVGGISTYNRNLISGILNEHDITEFPIYNKAKKIKMLYQLK